MTLGLVGCAHPQPPAQPRPDPVTVRLLTLGTEASVTGAALGGEPYLRVELEDGRAILVARAGQTTGGPRAAAAAAQKALRVARDDYRRLRFSEALVELDRAAGPLAGAAESAEDLALLGELALQQALNRLALDQRPEAAAAISVAIALGERGLTPGQLPPRVEAFISRTRVALAAAGTAELQVLTDPAGARVLLDGRAAGHGPLKTRLSVGRHHLRVEAPGYEPRGALIKVEHAGVQHIRLTAAPPAAQALQLVGRSGAIGDAAAQRALLAVLDAAPRQPRPFACLQVRRTDAGTEEASLLWVTASESPALLRCRGRGPAELRACLGPLLYRAVRGEPLPSQPAPRGGGSRSFYRSWWFWTVVGAGVAAGVTTGAVLGTRPRGVSVSIESLPTGLQLPQPR